MLIFYDPIDGQVMATYSGGTNSTVWEDRGFLRAHSNIHVTRNHRVVVEKGKVVSATPNPNPDQPVIPPAPLTTEELYDILETKGVLVEGDRPRPKLAGPR